MFSDDPVYVEQLADVRTFYAERESEADLARHVVQEWAGLLGCESRDVVTMLRIADLDRWCVVRGLDRPMSPDAYDPTDDLTLLATAVGQHEQRGDLQPVIRMAGLAAIDRLAQVVRSLDEPAELTALEDLRARLTN